MWAYLWLFVALALGFFCKRFYSSYKEYESYYDSELEQSNKFREQYFKVKEDAEKFYLIQRCVTVLRHPHPETVEITTRVYGGEHYISWMNGPPSGWRPYSYYAMYGDGRIIDKPEGIGNEKIIWPKNEEHVKQFFGNDSEILWLYIEAYRYLLNVAEAKGTSKEYDLIKWLKSLGLYTDKEIRQQPKDIQQPTDLTRVKEYVRQISSQPDQSEASKQQMRSAQYRQYHEYNIWLESQPDFHEFDDWLNIFLKAKGYTRDQWISILGAKCRANRHHEAQKLISDAYSLFHQRNRK